MTKSKHSLPKGKKAVEAAIAAARAECRGEAMKERKYNGWTNYETWNVKLLMDNEQGSYNYYGEIAQECYDAAEPSDSPRFTKDEQATLDLSARLKDEYETAMHDWLEESKKSASVWADLLGAALSEVNWHEIAENLMGDVGKETEESEA